MLSEALPNGFRSAYSKLHDPASCHARSWRKAAEDAEAAAAEALERVERTERQGAERGRALDARLRDVRAREAAVASKCATSDIL